MEPPTPDQADWSITKEEWDRIAPGQPKVETAVSKAAGFLVFVAPLAGGQKSSMVRVGRETQGRGGKGVSVITGLPLTQERLEELAKQLKKRCGCGGTVRNGVIEIQGDHRDLLVAELTRLGYPAKRSGG